MSSSALAARIGGLDLAFRTATRGVPLLACAAKLLAAQQLHSENLGAVRPESFVHEQWTVENGLPVNSVNKVLQTRDGYIWIATFDGLARFDGVRFTAFNSSNSSGIPSNRFVDLFEQRDGTLWATTEQFALVRYRNGVFTYFDASHGVPGLTRRLAEDVQGTLWVGTSGGLGMIRGDQFVPVALGGEHKGIVSIAVGPDGALWASTGDAVYRVHDGHAVSVSMPATSTASNYSSLFIAPDRTLWLQAGGLALHAGGQSEHLDAGEGVLAFRTEPRTGAMWVLTPGSIARVLNGNVTLVERRVPQNYSSSAITVDDSGRVVYASGAELHRDGKLLASVVPDRAKYLIGAFTINSVILDREGSYWVGTGGAGLHRLKPSPISTISMAEGLSYRNVYSVFQDRAGIVWVGTDSRGSNRVVDGRATPISGVSHQPASVFSYAEDHTGALWVGGGASAGLFRCAPGGERCTAVARDIIGKPAINAIHEDQGGTIWVGTSAGLLRYDRPSWRLVTGGGSPQRPVRVFAESNDGTLWMGSAGDGLARYREGRFRRITTADGLPLNFIRSLYQDADGWLWVGTEGRGLVRIDPREWISNDTTRRGRIVSFREKDGLFDEVIHQILEDDAGRLWMSTNRGIFWVARSELLAFADGRTKQIHSTGYTEHDGLRNREANGGSQPAGVKTRDGKLWFATQDGVAVIDPSRLETNRLPPNVVVEQVVSDGVAMVPATTALNLNTAQRDLEIQFTALSFVSPKNVRFRYRLEPYDVNWIDGANRRSAFYTKVPPGHYTFRVIASNNNGVWNERGAAVELHLEPHVWETRSFRIAMVLAFALLLVVGVRWRVHSLRHQTRVLGNLVDARTRELSQSKEQLEAQTEQLKELDRAKSRFFANVSHEFRTPLTLTIGPLEDLRAQLDGPDGPPPPRQLDMALRNSRRLLRLVNQILDVAKLEAGQMKLRARPGDIVSFTRGIASAFAPIAEQKGIAFDVASEPASIEAWFDHDAIEKVLANLLSNAFKFTPDDGRITLAISRDADRVRLRVSDSGPGIHAAHVAHVFERFYRVDESVTRAQPGTGIGLALTKELVELHHGAIEVTTEANAGATFVVTLPLGREHLRDEQIAVATDELPIIDEPGVDATRAAEEPMSASGAEDVTTLLVVDDNADLRAYVRAHFEPRYRVIEAADGSGGIAMARSVIPDLVISDVMMPGIDGNELCRALREHPETDFIPIILLTARASTDDRITGLSGGADDYLGKPFEMRELDARVETLIATRRRLRDRFATDRGETGSPAIVSSLSATDRRFVERLHAAIDARLSDPAFGVGELAQDVFLDRSHMFRRTRELLSATPSELIRARRLERGRQLLAEGAGSVAEVAYAVGFQSVSHFSRLFRETYGSSPAEFRDGKTAER